MEITFWRAVKIWWSYTWRTGVLSLPVLFFYLIYMAFSMGGSMMSVMSGTGEVPQQLPSVGGLAAGSILTTLGTLAAQVLAMRWTLHAGWRDFRLVAQPPVPDVEKLNS